MSKRTRVYLSLSDDELAGLDAERGTVPRATWIRDRWLRGPPEIHLKAEAEEGEYTLSIEGGRKYRSTDGGNTWGPL